MFTKQKSKSQKTILIGIIIGLFLTFAPASAAAQISPQNLISLTNSTRVQKGLAPLVVNSQLISAANLKAQDMLAKDYFAHTSPEGLNSWHWFKLAGYNYRTAGENLAIDFNDSSRVFSAWMASPSHRDNILDPDFFEIGIAAASGEFSGSTTTVVVQMFGTKVSSVSHQSQSPKMDNKNSDLNSGSVKSFQNDEINNFKFLAGFIERFKSLWMDTYSNLKQIFIKEIFLVFAK